MEGRDFLPLTVEYREKAYAGGKIPGGFFKREGRPDEKETLTCRLIDRPIRPLFPKGFRNEIQVINLVISADNENDPDVLAMIGASAALGAVRASRSTGPIGAVRVGPGRRHARRQPDLRAAGRVAARARRSPAPRTPSSWSSGRQGDRRGADARGAGLRPRAVPAARPDPEGAGGQRGQAALAVRRRRGHDPALEARVKELADRARSRRRSPSTRSRRAPRRSTPSSRRCSRRARRSTSRPGARPRGSSRRSRRPRCAGSSWSKGIRVDGRSVKEIRPICVRGRLPAARPRLGAVHARRDPGPGRRDARHQGRRAEDRGVRGRYATGASCCTTTSRRSRTGEVKRFGTAGPPRDRPRRARRAGGRAGAAEPGGVPVHDPHRLGDPRVQRLVVHGHGVRRLDGADGRGRAAQGAGGGHRHGPGQGGRQGRDPHRHHGHRGPLRRHGLQGRRAPRRASPALQMDIKIGGVSIDIMREALAQAREARLHVLGKMAETIKEPRRAALARTPRASSRSRSARRRSARSSAPAARSSAASRRRRAPRSTWRTTAR